MEETGFTGNRSLRDPPLKITFNRIVGGVETRTRDHLLLLQNLEINNTPKTVKAEEPQTLKER